MGAVQRGGLSRTGAIGLASAIVPVVFDLLFVHSVDRMQPGQLSFLVSLPGIVVIVNWGFVAAIVCMGLGVLLGLPAAFFEAVRTRSGSIASSSAAGEIILTIVPWMITFAAAFCVGYQYVFGALGATLLMLNTILARLVPAGLAAAVKLWAPVVIIDRSVEVDGARPASPEDQPLRAADTELTQSR